MSQEAWIFNENEVSKHKHVVNVLNKYDIPYKKRTFGDTIMPFNRKVIIEAEVPEDIMIMATLSEGGDSFFVIGAKEERELIRITKIIRDVLADTKQKPVVDRDAWAYNLRKDQS